MLSQHLKRHIELSSAFKWHVMRGIEYAGSQG